MPELGKPLLSRGSGGFVGSLEESWEEGAWGPDRGGVWLVKSLVAGPILQSRLQEKGSVGGMTIPYCDQVARLAM